MNTKINYAPTSSIPQPFFPAFEEAIANYVFARRNALPLVDVTRMAMLAGVKVSTAVTFQIWETFVAIHRDETGQINALFDLVSPLRSRNPNNARLYWATCLEPNSNTERRTFLIARLRRDYDGRRFLTIMATHIW